MVSGGRRDLRGRSRTAFVALAIVGVLTVAGVAVVEVVGGNASSAAPMAVTGGQLIWSDDFDGSSGARPDAAHWRAVQGGNGWGNQELECNTDAANTSALDGDGHLVITARYTPGTRCADGSTNDYSSARLSTATLDTVRYGSVRVRAQLPSGSGLWPAIWGLGADHETVGWPQSGEIDVAEVVGRTPDTVYQTLHGPSASGAYGLGTQHAAGRPVGDGFHVYGVDWSPGQISFSVDDTVTATYSRAEVEEHGTWVFDRPFYLLLDLAIGGSFPGSPSDPSVFPARMLVDYVRVYR